MAFITDITATIDEAKFKDPQKIMKILQPYKPKKNGSCYIVRETYEELEEIFLKLQREHISTHVRSVDVSAAVMVYIEKKCKNELSKIQGNSFVIETQPGLRTGTVQVTLRPRHVSISLDRANMVRQRFITFYQRTASDLQVTSVTLSPHKQDALQKRFPQLFFEAKQNKTEVTGPFMHVARLTEFIFQHTSTSRKSPLHNGRADGGGSRTSAPSPKHSKVCEDESCPICMDPIVTTKKVTLRCKHSFCRDCLKTAFDYKPVCPTCGELYGTLTGTQPDGGRMNFNTTSSSLPGYEKHGTIIIKYYIPSGIQKEEHPNPGQPYEGVSRTAYLPDSTEGKRILKMLRRAFDQRLIFTVGRSTTSGRNNMVTWNDIHHKTSTHGGPTHYGYPDPDYLSRVQDELKVKGIE